MTHHVSAFCFTALIAIIITVLTPSSVFAFDRSGSAQTLMLLIAIGGFSVFNLLIQVAFYLSGFYRSRLFAHRHVMLSLLPSLAALLFAVSSVKPFAALMMDMGLILVAVSLALVPLTLSQKPSPAREWISPVLSILLLAAGLVLTPITAFALILAQVNLIKLRGVYRYSAALVMMIGYPLLGYYLYQLMGKLA